MKIQRNTQFDPLGNITYGSIKNEEIVCFIIDDANKEPITIESIGITHPDPNYYIKRKHNDYYIFEYVVKGKGFIENDGQSYTVEEDDVYILEPGSKHYYHSDYKEPYEKIWINLWGEGIGDVIKKFNLSGKVVFKNSGCKMYFEQLIHIASTSNYTQEIRYTVASVLFQIICVLAEKEDSLEPVSKIAKECKKYVDNSLYSKMTIEGIAEILHISKAQLIRQFKKYYGVTPYKYLLTKKLDMAVRLLLTTNMSIGEISDSLAFADEHYFSDIFKKKMGVSPLQYRKTERKEP